MHWRLGWVFAGLLVLSGLSLPGASVAGATLDRVTRAGVLNDVLLNTYPPFGFIDATNQLAGFDVDVATAFAAKLNVKLHLSTPAWESIIGGHWQGRWDICICSLSPTESRARVLSFPIRYYSSPAVLTVHRNEQHIHSVADITGKRVGVGLGSSYEAYVNRALVIPGEPPITYPFHDVIVVPGDETLNFRNLALGPGVRLDAVISDLATAQAAIAVSPVLKLEGPTLYSEPNVIATEKGDPEWDRKVADIIRALRADGTLARISQKWFGRDITGDGP
ncbi:MAG: transporter substrate-binding domain-containing protein [Proteobacteria bacterium]|nr:transporter substrate-binding domain-containing protein [Pseudomonadota bacterium]